MTKYAVSGVLGTANTTSKKKQPKAVKKVVVSEFDKENVPSLRRSKRIASVSDLNHSETCDNSKISKSLPVKSKSKKIAVKHKLPATSIERPGSNKPKLEFPSVTSEENKTGITDTAAPENIARDVSISGVTEDSGFNSFNEVFNESTGSQTESSEFIAQPDSSIKQNPNNLISEERLKEFRSIVCKLFMKRHVESLPVSDLMDMLAKQKPKKPFSNEEINVALDKMTDTNQIMVANGTVYLI